MTDKAVVLLSENGEPYVLLGDYKLGYEEDEIEGHYATKAETELRETPEIVENSIKELQELMKAEEGLRVPIDDRKFLMKYLRPNKFYASSAFRVMRKYYKFKLKYPKYGSDLLPTLVEKAYLDEIVYFFPKRTAVGSRVMCVSVGAKWVPKEIPLPMLIKSLLVALEIAMGEPRTQVSGVHILMDLNGLSLTHITQFTPGLAKMILFIVQECIALRLKGIYVINQLPIFKLVYRIFKPFLGDKLKNRLHFIGNDWNTLKTYIDEDCLPPRCGGTLAGPDCPGSCLYKVIEHYNFRYEELADFGYKTVAEE